MIYQTISLNSYHVFNLVFQPDNLNGTEVKVHQWDKDRLPFPEIHMDKSQCLQECTLNRWGKNKAFGKLHYLSNKKKSFKKIKIKIHTYVKHGRRLSYVLLGCVWHGVPWIYVLWIYVMIFQDYQGILEWNVLFSVGKRGLRDRSCTLQQDNEPKHS